MSRKSKSENVIPAVGYLRKSTKGERLSKDGKKRQRQEKSIPQQKEEIQKLAEGRFEIVGWFIDEGVSGWKRGLKRPDFARMLDTVAEMGAQAILVDNLDRFSRAAVDEVQEDASALRKAGVRYIVTASHGTYDLGDRYSIGEILKFVVAVWSACEYSRQLSRRVALARRNAALDGRRTGGNVAYGLADDGRGGLKIGDPQEVKVVRWIFEQFVNEARTMRWIAGDLNRRRVHSPSGGKWSVKYLAQLLRRRAYRGDFVFNARHGGQFYGIDEHGEVVEREECNGKPGKLFVHQGVYKPLVEPALFDKAQRRLETLSNNRSRRKARYALSGVLYCQCGAVMHGRVPHKNGGIVYTCSSTSTYGKGTCEGAFSVREDTILPLVMRLLGEEITNLKEKLSAPPESLRSPRKAKQLERERVIQERDELRARIAVARKNVLLCTHARARADMDRDIAAMYAELEELEASVGGAEPVTNGYHRDELNALAAWWEEFSRRAVSVPVSGKVPLEAHLYQDPESEEVAVLLDARVVNEALRELGTQVHLRWETESYTTRNGVARRRHRLVGGRFRLGQKEGPLRFVTSGPPESPSRAAPDSSSVSKVPVGDRRE